MKYSEIVDIILGKLNLTADEAKHDNILTRIPSLCNEALGDIANRGKPSYKMLVFDIVPVGTVVSSGGLVANESVSTTRFITFSVDFLSLTNEFITRAPIEVADGVITETDEYETIDGSYFRRLNSRQLLFPNDTNYRYLVPVICRYPAITASSGETEIDIEPSIVELLPNYVVAELLRIDDVTLSTVYRNLYESSLAALNDTVLAPAADLHTGGW